MAVTPGPQFEQLPMFMSAREIMRKYEPLGHDKEMDRAPLESNKTLWSRKLDYAKSWGFPEELKRDGVQEPVELGLHAGHHYWTHNEDGEINKSPYVTKKPEIMSGHHRVISMMYAAPDTYMPVTHEDMCCNGDSAGCTCDICEAKND